MRILVPGLSHDSGGNPDLPLQYGAMRELAPVSVRAYTRQAALFGRPDVIHVNWPEWLIGRGHGPVVTAADCARALAELRVAKARGAKIVWTANNIRPHEVDPHGRVQKFVQAFSRLVDLVVCPSQSALDAFLYEYPALVGIDRRVIPLGHYRGVYPDSGLTADLARKHLGLPPDKRIALHFGMVRSYKNIPRILDSFEEIAARRDDVHLVIAGNPMPAELGTRIQETSARIGNVHTDLRRIPEADIQYYLRAANCVVVGTSFAMNSDVAMLALSFDRPVLIPHRGAAIDYRDVAGEQWVRTYDGGMRAAVLERAFDLDQPEGSPDLGPQHEWPATAAGLLKAFQDVVRHG